jgi:SAM-dependent methyltransferase
MTDEEEIADGAETPRYRHLVLPYLNGCGVDIGTGGYNPVVPWAIAVEQDAAAFAYYTSNRVPTAPIHLRCGALDLPFKDGALDFCYASNLIEDFADWMMPIREWTRVVKIGGYIVMLYPDKVLWAEEIRRGRTPNCQHRHESYPGEMSEFFGRYFGHFEVLADRLTALTPEDYAILFVARRVR